MSLAALAPRSVGVMRRGEGLAWFMGRVLVSQLAIETVQYAPPEKVPCRSRDGDGSPGGGIIIRAGVWRLCQRGGLAFLRLQLGRLDVGRQRLVLAPERPQ